MVFWQPKTLYQRFSLLVPWYYQLGCYVSVLLSIGCYWILFFYNPLLKELKISEQKLILEKSVYTLNENISNDSGLVLKLVSAIEQGNFASEEMVLSLFNDNTIVISKASKKIEEGIGYFSLESNISFNASYKDIIKVSQLLTSFPNVILTNVKIDNPSNRRLLCHLTLKIFIIL